MIIIITIIIIILHKYKLKKLLDSDTEDIKDSTEDFWEKKDILFDKWFEDRDELLCHASKEDRKKVNEIILEAFHCKRPDDVYNVMNNLDPNILNKKYAHDLAKQISTITAAESTWKPKKKVRQSLSEWVEESLKKNADTLRKSVEKLKEDMEKRKYLLLLLPRFVI